LSTMHGCVVLWLIDCALTVVSTMCAGNRRRCPSFIYTTACDAAHGSRSSRILFLPGGRGAAALSPWRRGATGWAHARTHEERPARASTAKLLWCARNVLCVAHACGLAVCVRGQLLLACVVMSRGFALPCWWFPVGRTINEPATPPPSRSPRRAELPLRVRNVCVLVEVRVVLVGLHGGWQPQTTKGEKGRVFGRLKSRHVEPP
jgi:hypothetical protein